MAKFKSSVLGSVKGSIGNVVFSRWKKSIVVKEKNQDERTNFSEKQLLVQSKFRLIASYAKTLRPVIKLGFRGLTAEKTEFNIFIEENFQYITGDVLNLEMNFSKLILSKGVLEQMTQINVTKGTETIKLDWNPNSSGQKTDSVTVVVLEPSSKQIVMDRNSTRETGTTEITFPQNWNGKEVHLFSFASDSFGNNSNNSYLGKVNLT
ncbi:MAG: DUF6266 family protein [Leptospiraceae bacterium]|nr:DUF6266 family protein [Leptospiraceae bacterium]